MTEAQWLACDGPESMLSFLRGKASDRKMRLFICACVRRVWSVLDDKRSRRAVEVGERYADGQADAAELSATYQEARKATSGHGVKINPSCSASYCCSADLDAPGFGTRQVCVNLAYGEPGVDNSQVQKPGLAALLREVIGGPAPRPGLPPLCRTSAVVSLALAAYEERELPSGHLDNARLAVLSDALEEAGCTDELALSHLRSSGPHVRGCWALDLVLAKG